MEVTYAQIEEKKHLEHQIIHLENDNQKFKELVGKEREKIEKLKAKLQESEKKQKVNGFTR